MSTPVCIVIYNQSLVNIKRLNVPYTGTNETHSLDIDVLVNCSSGLSFAPLEGEEMQGEM
jgi:hypothetical protein